MYVLPLSNKIPENVVIVIMLTSSYLVILYYIGMKFICVQLQPWEMKTWEQIQLNTVCQLRHNSWYYIREHRDADMYIGHMSLECSDILYNHIVNQHSPLDTSETIFISCSLEISLNSLQNSFKAQSILHAYLIHLNVWLWTYPLSYI